MKKTLLLISLMVFLAIPLHASDLYQTIRIDAQLWLDSKKVVTTQLMTQELSKSSVTVDNVKLTVRPILKCNDKIVLLFEVHKDGRLISEPLMIGILDKKMTLVIDEATGPSLKLTAHTYLME